MTNKKLNIGIVFGGKSAEHEVSLQSAKNVVAAIDRKRYRPVLIGIDKSGRWNLYDSQRFLTNEDDPAKIALSRKGDDITLRPHSGGIVNNLSRGDASLKLDVIFPLLHGSMGEDGNIQGGLKTADVPFVGSDVLGSAIGMDKHTCKRLLRDAGITVADWMMLELHDDLPDYEAVVCQLGSPFFVKPASQGSSVGVSKVDNIEQYEQAVNHAFDFDNRILLEQFIDGREIECAVLGNRRPIPSVTGEIICHREFYSYSAKYIDENGAALQIPAKLPFKTASRVQSLALEVFKALCCKGLARVDFFVDKDDEIVVNEVNTMPGFTSISMYPRLWQASGICYSALINRLISLALEQFDYENRPQNRVFAA